MNEIKRKEEAVCMECGNPAPKGSNYCDKHYIEFLIEEIEEADKNPWI